jgi:hypothetical protein
LIENGGAEDRGALFGDAVAFAVCMSADMRLNGS